MARITLTADICRHPVPTGLAGLCRVDRMCRALGTPGITCLASLVSEDFLLVTTRTAAIAKYPGIKFILTPAREIVPASFVAPCSR
jgi:hypothetical protein